MRPIASILLAHDFRPSSADVSAAAGRLAHVVGARLSLLHVASDVTGDAHRDQMLRHAGRDMVDAAAADFARRGVTVERSDVVTGPVVDCILRAAETSNPDLIVLGAGEPDALGHVACGPITESVFQHGRPSVLAVRAGDPPLEFRSLLCPIDGSPVSINALRHAVALARAFSAKLTALMVVPEVKWFTASAESAAIAGASPVPRLVTSEEFAANWIEDCARAVDAVDFQGVEYEKDVRHGAADRAIVAAAQESGADLILMGATGRSGIARLLMGSTSRRVLRRLPCSLWVTHASS